MSVLFTNTRSTMNEKFCILHIQQARVFVNKTRTQQSLTHLIYDLSSLVVLASKSRTDLTPVYTVLKHAQKVSDVSNITMQESRLM